jgi:peptide/nickel transport system substrate-binding protein
MHINRTWFKFVAVFMLASLFLGACTTAEPEVVEVEKVVTQVVKETVVETIVETVIVQGTAEVVQQEVTREVEKPVVVTATPVPPEMPQVGGTFVMALTSVGTLDAQYTSQGDEMVITNLLGSTLVAKDVEGNYVPYLATSWTTSDDGLIWDFTLRDDVKFHDGTPLTAQDYAWTFQRMLDPENTSPQRGRAVAIASAEAVDDYTLRLTLNAPYPVLLEQLSNTGVFQPLLQSAVEASGEDYGRNPVGVGPYKFVEWQTGERVVIERNPDFDWGPPFVENRGPFYIQTMEFRLIGEPATVLAGLEAGELDYASVLPTDLQRIEDTGAFQIIETVDQGMYPALHMQVQKPPFDDILVRQAFNYAIDKDVLIKVVAEGQAVPQYGPLSPNMKDYWPGVEYVGYGYELDQAKALMEEAGYTYNGEGMLEKDGEPLKVVLKAYPQFTKLAEVLQEQYKALGVDIEIELVEPGILFGQVLAGEHELAVFGYTASESDILYRWFHSSRSNALNLAWASDPELDRLLDLTRNTVDPDKRLEWVNEVQKYIVEQAYVVPLYAPKSFWALSNRVKGATQAPLELLLLKAFLNDAYIETQ